MMLKVFKSVANTLLGRSSLNNGVLSRLTGFFKEL